MELKTTNLLQACASIVVTYGDYEYEGKPKIDEISAILAELTEAYRVSPATISEAKIKSDPAVTISIAMDDPKKYPDETAADIWKAKVYTVIANLAETICGSCNGLIVYFNDGTATYIERDE